MTIYMVCDLDGIADFSKIEPRIKKLLSEKSQNDPYKRYAVLSHQLAIVDKSMRYSMIYPEQKNAHVDYLKTELSDLLVQTVFFAKLFVFDIDQLIELGTERLNEYKKHVFGQAVLKFWNRRGVVRHDRVQAPDHIQKHGECVE